MISIVLVSWAAITKHYGGLKQQEFISRNSGAWKSQIKVLVNSAPNENSLLGLQTASHLLCPHMAFLGCMHMGRDRSLPVFIMPPILSD